MNGLALGASKFLASLSSPLLLPVLSPLFHLLTAWMFGLKNRKISDNYNGRLKNMCRWIPSPKREKFAKISGVYLIFESESNAKFNNLKIF